MKKFFAAALGAVILTSSPLMAAMVKSTISASNGVEVTLNSDEFSGRYEYSAPAIRFKSDKGAQGYALVAKVKKGSVLGDLNVQGFLMYSGEWRFFRTAVFRGGDPVDYKRIGGDVGSCRYGCTLTESYQMNISRKELESHEEDGNLRVQIRADSGDTAIVTIPVAYFSAVEEVAK